MKQIIFGLISGLALIGFSFVLLTVVGHGKAKRSMESLIADLPFDQYKDRVGELLIIRTEDVAGAYESIMQGTDLELFKLKNSMLIVADGKVVRRSYYEAVLTKDDMVLRCEYILSGWLDLEMRKFTCY